jgi:DNA-binding NtrC family response regulator
MNRVPVNILVVEDEADIALGISRSLSKLEGVNCVTCSSSAEQALEKMRITPYSIVVSDICLTGMNGLNLLSSIKRESPDTCVVLMTAFNSKRIQYQAEQLGSDIYLEKPFDLSELKKIIKHLLDGIRSKQLSALGCVGVN